MAAWKVETQAQDSNQITKRAFSVESERAKGK
jgi:hypothetical protein